MLDAMFSCMYHCLFLHLKLMIYVLFMLLNSFRIYFGTKPFLFTTDLNMIKEVTVKQFDKFVDRTVSNFLLTRSSFSHRTSSL